MRRLLFVLTMPVCLCAQTQPAASAASSTPAASDAAVASTAASADSATKPGDEKQSGFIETGYRWNGTLHGNLDTYRSVVNLGEGPRLLGFEYRYRSDHAGGWLDRLQASASGWGGEPYASFRGEAFASGKYRFQFDQRSLAYFNALPSFANPQIDRGLLFSQSQWDIRHRVTAIDLELRPGTRIVPYVGYLRDRNSGGGVSTYVSSLNEYPVATNRDDRTHDVRAGVRFELSRAHLTLEQGGTTYNDDQRLFTNNRNTGNRTTPFLGQTLLLNSLAQAYDIEGHSVYSKVLFTAEPFSRVNVFGDFLYAQPKTSGTLTLNATGVFSQQNAVGLTAAENAAILSAAKQPHVTAHGGIEARPLARLRIIESFLTDRYHTAGAVESTGTLDRLTVNYNTNTVEALADVSRHLTLRGGYRYSFGDMTVRAPSLASDLRLFENGRLELHSALFGATYRIFRRLTAYVDTDLGRTPDRNSSYYAVSLHDYEKVRVRGSWQALETLTVTGSYAYFHNENPNEASTYSFDSRSLSASITYSPKRWAGLHLIGEYTRSTFESLAGYRIPNTFELATSEYRDRGHSGSGFVEYAFGKRGPRVEAGGSFWYGSGSRSTHFYQPQARLRIPLAWRVEIGGEWRWYGLSEAAYLYENFRQHQGLISVRWTL